MSPFTPSLSKSKYLAGLQCHKLLWYHYNAKDKIPPPDQHTQAIFDQGHLVGQFAKRLFPGGVEIEASYNDFPGMLKQTREALLQRKPIFEAALQAQHAFARADILNPVGKNAWDIIEVKSSTEVKDVNLEDIAFQKYTYENAGLKVGKCFVMYINNKYVRKGDIEPEKLFIQEDVTKAIEPISKHVKKNIETMLKTIQQKTYPDIPIGTYCSEPYGCALKELCWDFLPEDNVLTLYGMRKERKFALIYDGIIDIKNLPSDFALSKTQQIQVDAIKTGKPHIDKGEITKFLGTIEYPAYFLDFETFMTAIPMFDLVRPYQKVPFQYSLHVLQSEKSSPEHYWFLSDGTADPRPIILEQLAARLGDKGSIVCYKASFEKGTLKDCSEVYGKYAKWYERMESRILDLLKPFETFAYYHPGQHGTASIKAVLPALTGKGYENLDIAEGETASNEYLRVTFGTDIDPEDKQKVFKQLEVYCKLDTQAMVDVLGELRRISR
ncbi:MAG: DUF2779 domain-containing protein [Bacteroidota bacterium]|jgi:hypothetical protein